LVIATSVASAKPTEAKNGSILAKAGKI